MVVRGEGRWLWERKREKEKKKGLRGLKFE